jgi:alkylation response protein AidB-like acyl-CoA dehydrogenase
MFTDAIIALLRGHCTPAVVQSIDQGGDASALSGVLLDSGFLDLLVPETQGGGGASWPEFFGVAQVCGMHALPLPLAQTMAARALLPPGVRASPAWITFAPWLTRDADGALQAQRVSFARTATLVLGFDGDTLLALPVQAAQVLADAVPGSLSWSLRWGPGEGRPVAVPGTRWPALTAQRLQGLAAAVHAALIAGAMHRAFDLAMAHANTRSQFGKPIGKFQAIQHQLSVAAQQVAAASIAAQAAFHTLDETLPALPACAAAKARASEAASQVAAIAHAVHGAIGVTQDYELQLHTRRLHEWRGADGSEAYWYPLLGRLALQARAAPFADVARAVFA